MVFPIVGVEDSRGGGEERDVERESRLVNLSCWAFRRASWVFFWRWDWSLGGLEEEGGGEGGEIEALLLREI